jgi:hypothetical protein
MNKIYTDKQINKITNFVRPKYVRYIKIFVIIIIALSFYSTGYQFYVSYKIYLVSEYSPSDLFELISNPRIKSSVTPIDLYLTKNYWKALFKFEELSIVILIYIFFIKLIKYSDTIVMLNNKLKGTSSKA